MTFMRGSLAPETSAAAVKFIDGIERDWVTLSLRFRILFGIHSPDTQRFCSFKETKTAREILETRALDR